MERRKGAKKDGRKKVRGWKERRPEVKEEIKQVGKEGRIER